MDYFSQQRSSFSRSFSSFMTVVFLISYVAFVPLSALAHGVGQNLNFIVVPASSTSVLLSWISTSASSSSLDQHDLTIWVCSGVGCSFPASPVYNYTGHLFTTANTFTTPSVPLTSGSMFSGTKVHGGLTTGGTYSFKIREKHGGSFEFVQTITDIIVVPPQCSDLVDNADPEDTLVDLADPGCSSPIDNDETNVLPPPPPPPPVENTLGLCSDGIDNDLDGPIDLADSDCAEFMPRLTVIKHVVNDNGGTAVASDWIMDVTGTDVSNTGFAGSESGEAVTLKDGSYGVDESGGPSGYLKSTSQDCSGSMSVGDVKTCTITNDDIGGILKIQKRTVGGYGTFGFTISNQNKINPGLNPNPFSLNTAIDNNPALESFFDVFVDIYSILENIPNGWDTTSAGCDNQDGVGAVHVGLNQTVTCTFENTKRGSITVHKNVVAPDGQIDVSDSHEFFVTLDGDNSQKISEAGSYKFANLIPGTYTVAESIGDPDFDLLRISDDNDEDASNGSLVTVMAGEDMDVTITNKQKPGRLTVKKVVVNHGIGNAVSSDFTMSVTGTNVFSTGFPGSEGGTSVTLDPGSYSVGESGPNGYAMSQSNDCYGTMASNGNVICTITNSDIPTGQGAITVIKHVDNLHGGLLGYGDFTIYINGDSVTSGVAQFLLPGDYAISEGSLPSGYVQKSVSCYNGDNIVDNGSITLGEQEAWVCTITNEDVQPFLTVDKIVLDPKENENYIPSFFDIFVDLDLVMIGEANGFNAGEHAVTESLAGENNFPEGVGYSQSFGGDCDEDGNVTLTVGDDLSTCTITNTIIYAACVDGIDNDNDGKMDFGGENPDPSCSSASDNNENDTDETKPVSTFDSSHSYDVIDTELVQLSLSGQSTDNVGPMDEPKSGVKSAVMELFKLADAETMTADSFFDITYREMNCQNLGGQVPIEIVALSLVSVDPLTVSWDPTHQQENPLAALDRGVYCAVVHATDNAGNVENTAIAGPFAYTFVPPVSLPPAPPPAPPPSSTPTPPPPPSGGGGGGGGNGPPIIISQPNSSPVLGGGPPLQTPSLPSLPQGQVLGASIELPAGCTAYLNDYIKLGRYNNPVEVKKLQEFLNEYMKENLPVTGFYGQLSFAAVKRFQVKEADNILEPWVKQTGSVDMNGTGYVYKTTKRWINLLKCQDLDIPIPQLP